MPHLTVNASLIVLILPNISFNWLNLLDIFLFKQEYNKFIIIMTWKLYDYVDEHGVNDIKRWSETLEKRQLAKLNQKLDKLEISGPDLSPQLLSDAGESQIKKLKVKGNVQLRPLLCIGPINRDSEFTLLLGAIEKGGRYIPKYAPKTAKERRKIVIKDTARRVEHEQI